MHYLKIEVSLYLLIYLRNGEVIFMYRSLSVSVVYSNVLMFGPRTCFQ